MLDELAMFQQWKAEILPEIRAMLLNGASTKDLLNKYSRHAAARIITTAITDPDSAKALTAAKDILDRIQGKATERKEITHAMSQLSDEQLDALLLTQISEGEEEENKTEDFQ